MDGELVAVAYYKSYFLQNIIELLSFNKSDMNESGLQNMHTVYEIRK